MLIVFNHQHSTTAVAYKQFSFIFNIDLISANVTKVMLLKRNETKETTQCNISLSLPSFSLFFSSFHLCLPYGHFLCSDFPLPFCLLLGQIVSWPEMTNEMTLERKSRDSITGKLLSTVVRQWARNEGQRRDGRDGPMGVMT